MLSEITKLIDEKNVWCHSWMFGNLDYNSWSLIMILTN